MCGRFTLTADVNALQIAFPWVNIPVGMSPRYNIAPSQPVAVVPNDGQNRLDSYLWGLVPSWAKDIRIGNHLINARAETLMEKPSFKNAFRRRRCLVISDGFYEWKTNGNGKRKIPMYITFENHHPFAFAGLWDIWHAPDGSEIRSCTIITCEPNQLLKPIHNRMPVILSPQVYRDWLSFQEVDPDQLRQYLAPYPASDMIAYPVSNGVNDPAYDNIECIRPYD